MNKRYLLQILIIVVALAASAYFYPVLPSKVASHWNAAGQVDGYMDKLPGAFLLPILIIGLTVMFKFLPKLDPLNKNQAGFQEEYGNFTTVIIAFMAYLHLLLLLFNTGYSFSLVQTLLPALAVLFYSLSLLLEKAKRNWFIGIRTPWTLSSEKVWSKTNSIAAQLFKAIAVISFISAFLFPNEAFLVIFAMLIATGVFSLVYSYIEFKKTP